MKIIDKNSKLNGEGIVLCLGTFDGLHIGHKSLIDRANEISKQNGYKTCVHTFENIPAIFFHKFKDNISLFTVSEKIKAFDKTCIDYLWIDKFSNELANIECEEFMNYLTGVLNIKHIVVGFNYSFGKDAKGNTDKLTEFGKMYGFNVNVIDPVKLDLTTISSSEIRKYISDGKIETANKMLGRNYQISGKVIYGLKNGTKIDFPTINIDYNIHKVLPKFGVYATKTKILGKTYYSITNVGNKPTIPGERKASIETNIFEFDKMCYDECANVEFIHFVRPEKPFSGLNELRYQIINDVDYVKNYFERTLI